jgi:hypothetical protein
MITLLAAGRELQISPRPNRPKDELWLDAQELRELTGWQLEHEGLCKDAACVPLSESTRARFIDGDAVNAAGLWEELGRPALRDASASTWLLGEAASTRSRQLESLQAPDFSLPDITGKLHSLSDYRGKKVFLATWASW